MCQVSLIPLGWSTGKSTKTANCQWHQSPAAATATQKVWMQTCNQLTACYSKPPNTYSCIYSSVYTVADYTAHQILWATLILSHHHSQKISIISESPFVHFSSVTSFRATYKPVATRLRVSPYHLALRCLLRAQKECQVFWLFAFNSLSVFFSNKLLWVQLQVVKVFSAAICSSTPTKTQRNDVLLPVPAGSSPLLRICCELV